MSVTAQLTGPFRMESSDGVNLTPRSAKTCGLLLLLLTAPNGCRERAWLQDKLWSDRGKSQGAGSLRQAIHQCKSALGPQKALLTATKLRVALDMDQIMLSHDHHGDFAEGLDVRDPEFESWLAVERSVRAEQEPPLRDSNVPSAVSAQQRPKVTLVIEAEPSEHPLAQWFVEVFADQCASLLDQIFGADVVVSNNSVTIDPEFRLHLTAVEGEGGWFFLRGRLSEAPVNVQIWSGYRILKSLKVDPGQDQEALKMAFEVSEAVRHRLNRRETLSDTRPPALSATAISNMFEMTERGASVADSMLQQAYAHDPRASHLAWRALVRVIQVFEGYALTENNLAEESEALTSLALEKEPSNSLVLAMAANGMNYLENKPESALAHAHRAAEIGTGNPFAWWTLAAVQLSQQMPTQAYATAAKARQLFSGSSLEFLPESILGGAALAVGDEETALDHFEKSHSFRPTFKPALRYAIGLNAKRGHTHRARVLAAKLLSAEYDFSPERLVEDGTYPTSLLRFDKRLDVKILRDLGSGLTGNEQP